MPTADLTATLRTLDHLTGQDQATLQAILTAQEEAGRPLSADQALVAMTEAGTLTTTPEVDRAPASRWRRWRSRLGRATASVLAWEGTLIGGWLVSAWAAQYVYGKTALAVMTSSDFQGLVLLLAGIGVGITIFRGTLATAKDGEVLGEAWSSLTVPVHLTVLSLLLLPLIQGISALAWLTHAIWG